MMHCCAFLQAEAVAAARAEVSARAAAMQDELQHKLQELQQAAAQVRPGVGAAVLYLTRT
jgi:hypothetical protein